MPGDSGVLVVTRVRSTTTIATRPRVHWASGIPHALFGRKIDAQLGRSAPRDREVVCGIRAPSLRAQRSNPSFFPPRNGLLRCARNDGLHRMIFAVRKVILEIGVRECPTLASHTLSQSLRPVGSQ